MGLAEYGQVIRALLQGHDPAALPPPAELLAAIVLESDRPEWAFRKSEYLFIGFAAEGAGVGARSQIALLNPSGSGCVATVTHQAGYTETLPTLLHWATEAQLAAFDNDGTEGPRDTRLAAGGAVSRSPACRVLSDTAAAAGTLIARIYPVTMIQTGTEGICDLYDEFVIWPGNGLVMVPLADNVAGQWTFTWRERAFEPDEVRGAVGVG